MSPTRERKGALTIRIAVALLVVSSIGLTLHAQQRETEQNQSAHHSSMMKRGNQEKNLTPGWTERERTTKLALRWQEWTSQNVQSNVGDNML